MRIVIARPHSVVRLGGIDVDGLAASSVLDRIVVPLDGDPASERAVQPARTIARRLGAEVHLLTTKFAVGHQSARDYLEQVAGADGASVSTEVMDQLAPADAIATASPSDRVCICMATHARGRLLSAVHPNIADTVLDATATPVLLIGPNCGDARLDGTVVMAHDGSAHATHVAEALIPIIAVVGRALHVVTVVEGPMGRAADDPFSATRATVAPLLEAATHAGLVASHHLAFGKYASTALLGEIRSIDASFVVMAAHHHSWLEHLREGSTIMSVVHDSTVPVLVAHDSEVVW